jgi:hypothetical protein
METFRQIVKRSIKEYFEPLVWAWDFLKAMTWLKFFMAMILLGCVSAFFGRLYVGIVNKPDLLIRFMLPWMLWMIFFVVLYLRKSLDT